MVMVVRVSRVRVMVRLVRLLVSDNIRINLSILKHPVSSAGNWHRRL